MKVLRSLISAVASMRSAASRSGHRRRKSQMPKWCHRSHELDLRQRRRLSA